eukprot:810330_1
MATKLQFIVSLLAFTTVTQSTQIWVAYVDDTGTQDTTKTCTFSLCNGAVQTLHLNQVTIDNAQLYELNSNANEECQISFDPSNPDSNCLDGDLLLTAISQENDAQKLPMFTCSK